MNKEHPEGTDYHTVRKANGERVSSYLSKAGYANGGRIKDESESTGDNKGDDGEDDMEPRQEKKRGGKVMSELKEDKKMIKAAVHKHEKHDHPGKPMTKLKEGGNVEGHKSPKRLDKYARGGGIKHKPSKGGTKVNVIVAGGHDGGAPGAMGAGPDPKMAFKAGMMVGAKGAAAAGGPPPGGAAGPMMPPAGGMPGGAPMPPPGAKRGGRMQAPKMEAGAGSGLGRLEKTEMAKKDMKKMKRGGNC